MFKVNNNDSRVVIVDMSFVFLMLTFNTFHIQPIAFTSDFKSLFAYLINDCQVFA